MNIDYYEIDITMIGFIDRDIVFIWFIFVVVGHRHSPHVHMPHLRFFFVSFVVFPHCIRKAFTTQLSERNISSKEWILSLSREWRKQKLRTQFNYILKVKRKKKNYANSFVELEFCVAGLFETVEKFLLNNFSLRYSMRQIIKSFFFLLQFNEEKNTILLRQFSFITPCVE